MRVRLTLAAFGAALLAPAIARQAQAQQHLNPVIDAIIAKKPIFGISMPTAGRGGGGGRGGRGGAVDSTVPTPPPPPVKTPLDLAKEALAYTNATYLFSGGTEGNAERAMPAIEAFIGGLSEAGWIKKSPAPVMTHPIGLKFPTIRDSAKTIADMKVELNGGASVIHFTMLSNVAQARQGIAAMRFKSKGGTRPDDVGSAPKYWGMTDAEYRDKADLWPLNPKGELVLLPIVETKEGIENIREIAAEKGIAGIVIGAGTLGGVFRGDSAGFNAAVTKILAACKEFNKPCGYPALDNDIEGVMKKGFSIIIIQNWGERGFKAVEIGRKVGGG